MTPAKISIIVAHDDKLGIAKNQQIPWHISEDLKRFKATTLGHPIIMGRKTFASINKPLPGRLNIIITRNKDFKAPPGCFVAHSLKEAISLAREKNNQEIFIIGGGEIYRQALDQNLVNKLYLTHIKGDFNCDVFFPDYSNFNQVISQKKSQDKKHQYTFLELKNLI